jgi:hypothetical protein
MSNGGHGLGLLSLFYVHNGDKKQKLFNKPGSSYYEIDYGRSMTVQMTIDRVNGRLGF